MFNMPYHCRLLQNHTHPLLPAPSYYLETPEYPPEDIETPLAPPKVYIASIIDIFHLILIHFTCD